MFPKRERYSFKKGLPKHTLSTPFFILRYQKNDLSKLQCAVVVGKKVDKRATARNKLKRRFVHIVKEITEDKNISYDFVFFLKKQIIEIERDQVKAELEKILVKITIL